MGAPRDLPIETVLLSIHNRCLNWWMGQFLQDVWFCEWKHFMDAHENHLFWDGFFEYPRQILNWMAFRTFLNGRWENFPFLSWGGWCNYLSKWNLTFIFIIKICCWCSEGSPHWDGSFENQKQVLKWKLMDGIVSPVCLIGSRFSYLRMKKCHGCSGQLHEILDNF